MVFNYLKNFFSAAPQTQRFDAISQLVADLKDSQILYLQDQDLLFNIGDRADLAYLILEGKVRLLLPKKHSYKFTPLILHKDHFFGELGILNQRPRSGTAVAQGKVKLLAIPSHELMRQYHENPQLSQHFAKLQSFYSLPVKGAVEEYIHHNTITNHYHLESGIHCDSIFHLDSSLFRLRTQERGGEKFGHHAIEITVKNKRLIEVTSYEISEYLADICEMLLNQEEIESEDIAHFIETGKLAVTPRLSQEAAAQVACECMGITCGQIQHAINQGLKDIETLKTATGACLTCKGCTPKILEMLGVNPWLKATLKLDTIHNERVHSFTIQAHEDTFNPFIPGQYVLIQVGAFERPYSISDVKNDKEIRITVKKEEKGHLTDWLFRQRENDASILVTQPQGDFLFDLREGTDALCFAGGIGITPFIAYVKTLALRKSTKRVHIHYSAGGSQEFIFTEEFNRITLPDFTITYNTERLTEEQVMHMVRMLNQPHVYICGSEKYVSFVIQALAKGGYDPAKIHYEKYIFAKAIAKTATP